MGPTLTLSLAILVGAVATFGSAHPAPAQHLATRDQLAVRMPDDATGVDVTAVVQIAVRVGVPVGFEEAGALAEAVRGPFRPVTRQKPLVSVRPTPLDLRGVTLRAALDAVVAKDRRYAWRFLDGVVVVRPVAAWRDPAHPLLRPMHAIRAAHAALATALDSPRPADGSESSVETLLDHLVASVRDQRWSYWFLSPSSGIVLLDGGRAVEVAAPELRLGGADGETTLGLWR